MNRLIINKNPNNNRLFLGLAVGLAATLCAFEYGEPKTKREIFEGWFDEDSVIEFIEPIRIEEPKKQEEKMIVRSSTAVVISTEHNERVDSIYQELEDSIFHSQGLTDIIVPEPDPNAPWITVEIWPEFAGGEVAMFKFMSEHTKYPSKAKSNNIEGNVYVQFVVEKDGTISHVEILRSANHWLDEEAKRVVSIMPRWKPGIQQGQPVAVTFKLPFKFALNH